MTTITFTGEWETREADNPKEVEHTLRVGPVMVRVWYGPVQRRMSWCADLYVLGNRIKRQDGWTSDSEATVCGDKLLRDFVSQYEGTHDEL